MKLKSILLVMLALCLTLCLCACGDKTDPKKDEKPSTTVSKNDNISVAPSTATTTTAAATDAPVTEAPTTTTAPTATTPTQPVDGKANYTVIVTDEAGNPVPGVFVQLCLESCIPCMTNAQGVASYPNMAVADYKVSFINFPEGYTVENNEFHFAKDSYELTIVLKAAN